MKKNASVLFQNKKIRRVEIMSEKGIKEEIIVEPIYDEPTINLATCLQIEEKWEN